MFYEWRSRFLDSPPKIYLRIHTRIQTGRRKVAITKKFIKDSTLSRRESWQALGVATALKIEGSFPFM